MKVIVETCNEKESCAGILNLDCNGETYQTCNVLENGPSFKKCTYKKKNRHINDVSKQPSHTTGAPNLIARNTNRHINNVSKEPFQTTGSRNSIVRSVGTTSSKLLKCELKSASLENQSEAR